MKIDDNIATIELAAPTKFNISDGNMTFVYTLISPKTFPKFS